LPWQEVHKKEGQDVVAMEMTKWFDTNYHYIVPEFTKRSRVPILRKIIDEFKEATILGIRTKPVLIGPVTYLLLGKEKNKVFIELIDLINCYLYILKFFKIRS
jgi:5-methyltetrahydropteroyltriglutamate--homocysteine methyltransferase